jgi:WD40 repeat protein
VVFSPDKTKVVSSSTDHTLRLWDGESGILLKTLEGHQDAVRSVVFSPDGKQIASGSEDRTIRLWDGESGTLIRILQGHQGSILSISFSPDATLLATGSSFDRRVYMWDLQNGKILAEMKGQPGWIRSLAFSPDGQFLVSCDTNGQVFLWKAGEKNRGQLLDLYVATYEIGAIHWEEQGTILLLDLGGGGFRPHIYELKLEGTLSIE